MLSCAGKIQVLGTIWKPVKFLSYGHLELQTLGGDPKSGLLEILLGLAKMLLCELVMIRNDTMLRKKEQKTYRNSITRNYLALEHSGQK